VLEKQIESKVCDYAKERGLLVYKFTSPARAAVPDRLFILPSGKAFFVEFKREGEKATPAQEREHHRLRQHKVSVWVIDNVVDGKAMVDLMVDWQMVMGC
jgi:hypothetical protein